MHAERDGDVLRMRIASDLARMGEAHACLSAFLAERGVTGRAAFAAELVFDEIVPNVIRHGLRGERDRSIDVLAKLDRENVTLLFEDDGPEFDPRSAEPPERATSLDDVRIGGLGLVLVRDFARSIDYERVGEINRLTVRVAR